jgi:hypothetical protein
MLNNLVVINLTDEDANPFFFSEEEVADFLIKMNINQPRIDDEYAFPSSSECRYSLPVNLFQGILGCVTGAVWWKVWINPENGYVIAYQDFEGKKFTDNFIRYIEEVPSLDSGDLPCNLGNNVVRNNTHLSLDKILEKIFSQGLESLTMEEVNYMAEISKDL